MSENQKGVIAMIGFCLCLTIMFVCGLLAMQYDEATSPIALSFVRVVINLILIVGFIKIFTPTIKLFGDFSSILWIRGLFGAANYVMMFLAIDSIGLADASFINSGSSIFVALLAIPVLREKFDALSFIATVVSLGGLSLIYGVNHIVNPFGALIALGSAACRAVAHLAVAKASEKNSPSTIIFYFCVCAVGIHLVLHATIGITFPTHWISWMFILLGSAAGLLGQYLLTYAYSHGKAQTNAALYYLGPAFNLVASIAIFSARPDLPTLLGGALIISFGAIVAYRSFRETEIELIPMEAIAYSEDALPINIDTEPQTITGYQ